MTTEQKIKIFAKESGMDEAKVRRHWSVIEELEERAEDMFNVKCRRQYISTFPEDQEPHVCTKEYLETLGYNHVETSTANFISAGDRWLTPKPYKFYTPEELIEKFPLDEPIIIRESRLNIPYLKNVFHRATRMKNVSKVIVEHYDSKTDQFYTTTLEPCNWNKFERKTETQDGKPVVIKDLTILPEPEQTKIVYWIYVYETETVSETPPIDEQSIMQTLSSLANENHN